MNLLRKIPGKQGLILLVFLLSCQREDYLKGFDKNALFASPGPAEIAQVKADWAQRDLRSVGYAIEKEVVLKNNSKLLLVSFLVAGYKEYGAVIIPPKPGINTIRMYVNGFDVNNPINSIRLQEKEEDPTQKPFILAIPALRGQSLKLTVNEKDEYETPTSEGPFYDAFDGATDDCIAFINAIASQLSLPDSTEVSVRGGSRGGTVALLLAERDKRIKQAVGVAFPTDLISLTQSSQNDKTYQAQFLEALKSGKQSVTQTRMKMIASSPIYFCEDLPPTQVHLAAKDTRVPVKQGDWLQSKMNELGKGNLLEYYVYPDRTHDDIGKDNTEMETRIQAFLSAL